MISFSFIARRNNHQNDLVEEMNATNTLLNGANGVESVKNGVCENDVEMISQPATAIIEENNKSNNSNSQTSPIITKSATNGTTNGYQNGNVHDDHVEDMGELSRHEKSFFLFRRL